MVVDAPELDVPDAVVEAGPPRVQRHHLDILTGERVVLQLVAQVERLGLVVILQTAARYRKQTSFLLFCSFLPLHTFHIHTFQFTGVGRAPTSHAGLPVHRTKGWRKTSVNYI